MKNTSRKLKDFFKFTIKQKIYAIAFATIFAIIVVMLMSFYSIRKIIRYDAIDAATKEIALELTKLRKLEFEFIGEETINPMFFETGESKVLDEFDKTKRRIDSILSKLSHEKIVQNLEIQYYTEKLLISVNNYDKAFHSLVKEIKQRGFKDYGTVGIMRNAIHKVMEIFENIYNYELLSDVMYLRRHEKDFIIRKDLKYLEKFRKRYITLNKKLNTFGSDTTLHGISVPEINSALKNYHESFTNMVMKDISIGLTPQDGLRGELINKAGKVVPLIALVRTTIINEKKQMLTQLYILLSVLITLLLGIIIVSSIKIIHSITRPINKLKKFIKKMSKGELPKGKLETKNRDEIADMTNLLNVLIERIRETALFAEQIGQGCLQAEYQTLGKKDMLGNALIMMRQNLQNAADESGKRQIIDNQQNWASKGIAKFAEILREENADIEELSYKIISNIVEYLNANQGGIFLLNDEDEEEKFIELKAAFVYDRRKYSEKKLEWGEGLIGNCILENNTVYLTTLPENYLKISSGLGNSKPACLLIVPLSIKNEIFGAIEIASFNELEKYQIAFVKNVAETIASTLSSVKINFKTSRLLKETQDQANIIKQNEEEMRQNMEEMKATQEESTRRETELNNLADAVNKAVGVIEYDFDGVITHVNEIICSVSKFPKAELIGQHHSILFFTKQIADSESYITFWKKMNEGNSHSGIFKRMNKDGKERYVNAVMKPFFTEKGKPLKVVELEFDITKFKQQEYILRERTDMFLVKEEDYQNEIKSLKTRLDKLDVELKKYKGDQ